MPGWGEGNWSEEFWGQEFVRFSGSGDVACTYVVFFDGLPTAYTTNEPGVGSIAGTGVNSWIGRSETVMFGVETVGQRTVKCGLVLPETIEIGGDPKGLGLDRSTLTLKIVDRDDSVAALFATEGVVPDILMERIAPGKTSLGNSVDAKGPGALTGTINPQGKWLGLEKIGPTGQRRQFPAIPFSLVGYDHQGDVGDRLPPVPISTTPVIHAGRLVTIYRIYADPSYAATDPDRWITWDQAWPNDLVWWGVMQDSGTYEGNRVWSVDCYGPESLLEKGLGQITQPDAYEISAAMKTDTGVNDQIFIAFSNSDNELYIDGTGEVVGAGFTDAGQAWFEGLTWSTLSSTARIDLVDEIDQLVKDTATGTGTNYNTASTPFDEWVDANLVAQADANPCGISHLQGFYIRARNFPDVDYYPSYGIMYVALHKSRWEALGYDIEAQTFGAGNTAPPYENEWQVRFTKLKKGDFYAPRGRAGEGAIVPGSGYYEARFTTVGIGQSEAIDEHWTHDRWRNDGQERYYPPLNTDGNSIMALDIDGDQEIRLSVDGSSPFWEGQPTVPRKSEAEVNSVATEHARWFALRGKWRIATEDESGETDIEEDDLVAVVDASWVEGDRYGDVATGGDVGPSLYIQKYHDPRLFGFNHKKKPSGSTWRGTVGGDFPITIAPLNCYTFGHGKPIEWAHLLLGALLLSTGTSTGFSAPLSEGGVLDLGDNQPGGLTSTGDVELADLGLGIPHQMVSDYAAITGEFAKVAGGLGGDLNRMRLCYAGPFESRDALEAILKPRRLAIGLHGKKYGVYRYEQFSPDDVDVTITEDDLYGEPGDPTSVIPRQVIRAHGAIDGAIIHYGTEPGGSAKLEHRQRSLDYNARWRRGDLVEELNGRGLIPTQWLQGTSHEGKNWKTDFQEEWGRRAPAFFSKRHFIVEDLKVSRPKGQDLMPGTRVLLSNPWPLAPDGTYGLNNRLGRVIGVSINTRHHYTTARVLVYGDVGFPPHFSPFVFVTGIASDVLTYDTSGTFTGYAINECETEKGWVRPSWSTNSNEVQGRLWYQGPTGDWVAGGTGTIESIDTAAGTITLAAPLSADPPPNTYTMIFVIDDYETNTDTWAADAYAPVTNHAGLYNTGGTDRIGKRWLE